MISPAEAGLFIGIDNKVKLVYNLVMPKRIITKNDLPTESRCPYSVCVYNELGRCYDLKTNRGNDDSYCHRMLPRDLLEVLGVLK